MDSDNLKWSIDHYEENTSQCDEILKKIDNFHKIPLMYADNHHFQDGDLVRYQGMVQDMLNPEYYYPTYTIQDNSNGSKVVKSGKFRDIVPCKENEELKLEGEVPAERLVFFCIPVPSMSPWVKDHFKKSSQIQRPSTSGSVKKRTMEDEDDEKDADFDGNLCDVNKSKKPNISENGGDVCHNDIHLSDKYFPLNEKTGVPCLVKVYEKEEKYDIVLNERIEIIGFLSLNPALENTMDDCDAEDKAMNPPPSLVPRIHAVFIRKLNHFNPLLNQIFNSSEIISTAEKVRSDLHLVLTQVLFGDTLAADYLICYLLSRIYGRNDGQALGKFSLNLFNIKLPNFSCNIYRTVEILVPVCQYLLLSIKTLNEKLFVPKKDYETNRLWSGRLQMCDDTYLILDETQMSEGKLEHFGCLNVAALQNLIREQEIHYDFSYYSVKYNTNASVLVLSEGKSMFETDIKVKLKPDPSMTDTVSENFIAATSFLRGEVSEKIRIYLTGMRLQEFEMSPEITKRIGDDYVNMRQEKNGINSNDLHNLLVLARLLALSYGRTSLTQDDWSRALEMETERKERLS